jgi:hypothetical protein
MSNLELFKIWAPEDRVWSQWAKPVLFAQGKIVPEQLPSDPYWPSLNLTNDHVTALLIDLPREKAVDFGIAAARLGYWPVPIFNCAYNLGAVLDVRPIVSKLHSYAHELSRMNLPMDAPPAFLVDSRRMNTDVPMLPGNFDNRYIVLPQDFPSGGFLRNHGINRVIWIRTAPGEARPGSTKEDLHHVLRRWQEAGLEVLEFHPGDLEARRIEIPKPSMFGNLFHRAIAMMGLRRNSAGGFGAIIPHPSSGG